MIICGTFDQEKAMLLWKMMYSDGAIAEKLFTNPTTVRYWRKINGLPANYGSAEAREARMKKRSAEAALVKDYRKKHGLTQKEFGAIFGLDFRKISHFECGLTWIPQEILDFVEEDDDD